MEEKVLKRMLIATILVSLLGSIIIGFGAGYWLGSGGKQISQINLRENNLSQKPTAEYQTSFNYEAQVIKVIAQAEDSVASIIATKDLPVIERYYVNPFGDLFNEFGPFFEFQIPQYRQKGTQPQEVSAGTGFVVSEDGYLVTNKHVVSDSEARYTVLLNDGSKYAAKVIARDPSEDFAVLKIEKNNLKPLKLGDSSSIVLGQTAIAIGNALGEFRNTVSVGAISGLARNVKVTDEQGQVEILSGLIQTDAAINRGNSGGPLLNLKGQVIGINTAIASNAENIGFAIPINKVKKSLESAIKTGKISVPYLGVWYTMINSDIKKEKNLPVDYGALIAKSNNKEPAVIKGSPAEAAGLKEGDIILEINGQRIDNKHPLSDLIRNYSVGEVINLKILRDGKELNIKVTLAERQD